MSENVSAVQLLHSPLPETALNCLTDIAIFTFVFFYLKKVILVLSEHNIFPELLIFFYAVYDFIIDFRFLDQFW